jgi:hypothetical protein
MSSCPVLLLPLCPASSTKLPLGCPALLCMVQHRLPCLVAARHQAWNCEALRGVPHSLLEQQRWQQQQQPEEGGVTHVVMAAAAQLGV